jgi:hypothetical protein
MLLILLQHKLLILMFYKVCILRYIFVYVKVKVIFFLRLIDGMGQYEEMAWWIYNSILILNIKCMWVGPRNWLNASMEVGLERNVEKTEYVLLSRHQNER